MDGTWSGSHRRSEQLLWGRFFFFFNLDSRVGSSFRGNFFFGTWLYFFFRLTILVNRSAKSSRFDYSRRFKDIFLWIIDFGLNYFLIFDFHHLLLVLSTWRNRRLMGNYRWLTSIYCIIGIAGFLFRYRGSMPFGIINIGAFHLFRMFTLLFFNFLYFYCHSLYSFFFLDIRRLDR